MSRFTNLVATIAAGEALSTVVDCSIGSPVMIFVPVGWTPARISFQVSVDAIQFNDLVDQNGLEIHLGIVEGTAVPLDSAWTPIQFLRLRSGGRDAPVPQQADVQIGVTLDTRAQAATMRRKAR